jgi:hypothetical protein
MPTQESWLDDNIIQTTWTSPLTSEELRECFQRLADWIQSSDHRVHVLFDITGTGSIPADAPVLAINSRFLTQSNIGKVAVVGMDIVPQLLARVAATVSRKDITFFPLIESALDYLKKEERP